LKSSVLISHRKLYRFPSISINNIFVIFYACFKMIAYRKYGRRKKKPRVSAYYVGVIMFSKWSVLNIEYL